MNQVSNKLSIRIMAFSIVCAVAVGFTTAPVGAAITMVNTLVAETASAFEKGVEFPLLGLHDSKPTFISARVFKWTQQPDNPYVLEPTEDFTVYPQLLRMGSDSRKSVMIKATKPLAVGAEGYYRIVLREFDRADGTDITPPDDTPSMAIATKPQASIPMIVRGPPSLKSAPLQVVGVRDASPPGANAKAALGAPISLLTLFNPGQVYERVVAISNNEPINPGSQYLGYVLAGHRIDIGMKRVKSGDHITVQYVIGADAKVDWTSRSDSRKTTSFVVP